MFAWFTNFDHWADYVGLSLWISAGLSLVLGLALMLRATKPKSKNSDDGEAKWKEEPSNPEPGKNIEKSD